jgi:hypothetical protein
MNRNGATNGVHTAPEGKRPDAFAAMFGSNAPARADGPIVLWVFRDYENRWCVRQEGGASEAAFLSRDKAVAYARQTGLAWGSYRLFIELRDGRVAQELLNLALR